MNRVLEVEDLNVSFRTRNGTLDAVRAFDLSIDERETVALVGESGSGKSVTSLSMLRLLPVDTSRIAARRLEIVGRDVMSMDERQLCALRGNTAAMVFQEPMTSLNPVMTIGHQIVEALEAHSIAAGEAAWKRAGELLELVRLSDARRRLRDYPHQLSGGMNQRVMIALAIACNPKLLIADEPTTALDVTIQAQIMRLIREIREEMNMGVLLITHDLALVAENADRVVVMYAGRSVEEGKVSDVLASPLHPYTIGLLAASPRVDSGRLTEIPGIVPSLAEMPSGCAFAPRCARATEQCRLSTPPVTRIGERAVHCFNLESA